MDQGTGIVHIAPGCGGEDFELSKVHDLAVLTPVDESGRFYDDYGWLHGLSTTEAADQIIGRLGETGFLVEAGLYTHAYPHCWRCDTPLIFRLSDDWFIGVDQIRQQLLDENAKVRMGARVHGQAHGRLAAQHGRLEHLAPPLLRPPVAVLPLLVRPSERGRLEGGAARARDRGLRPARGAAQAVGRSRSDPVHGLRRDGHPYPGGRRRLARRRDRSLLDARLGERRMDPRGVRDRRGARIDQGRPARSRPLGAVVPRRLGDRDARADPALVLLPVLHVGRPRRPLAVQARARLREDARREGPRDARLLGEHDPGRGRVRPDGRRRDALAVLRAASGPQSPLRVRAGSRDQAQAAHLLALGEVPRRLREHRGVRALVGAASSPTSTCARSTSGWSNGRGSSSGRRPRATRPR